jgi:recombination protein RecT
MSNPSGTPQSRDLKTIIASPAMQQQFAAALPKHLSAERFGRIAITALSRTPKLRECTQDSVFKCLLDLSAMGLEPDGRHSHLIPYGKECTLIIDYKGLVSLVRRSGEVVKIHADIVCQNDIFEHSMGEVTRHTYDLRTGRGEPYAAYAQVTLKDGSVQAAIMPKDEIESIRKRSRAANAGPWVTDWAEMAKKTAFRRLTKWLTISPEVSDAIVKADEHEFQEMRNATPQPVASFASSNPLVTLQAEEQQPQNEEESQQTDEPVIDKTPEEFRKEAMRLLKDSIKDCAITEETFWVRAKQGGWMKKNVLPNELTAEALVGLASHAHEIAEGEKKGVQEA